MSLAEPNSPVDICNLSLDYLKQQAIRDIDPPGNGVEEICARHYPMQRRATLRTHVWNFASKRITLTPTDSAPEFEYSHAYNLPNDFIRLVGLFSEDGIQIPSEDYAVEGGQVLYNGEDNVGICLKYIWDHDIVIKFDTLFIQVLAINLAIAIAPKFSGTEARIKTLADLKKTIEAEARSIDGQEKPPVRKQTGKWLSARRFGRTQSNSGTTGPYTIFS